MLRKMSERYLLVIGTNCVRIVLLDGEALFFCFMMFNVVKLKTFKNCLKNNFLLVSERHHFLYIF